MLCCRYDPVNPLVPGETAIEEDRELLEDFYSLEEDGHLHALTPWLLRLILDDRLTVDKKLGMAQIADKLKDEFDVSVCVEQYVENRSAWQQWCVCVCVWSYPVARLAGCVQPPAVLYITPDVLLRGASLL
jgi:hypothetical protein